MGGSIARSQDTSKQSGSFSGSRLSARTSRFSGITKGSGSNDIVQARPDHVKSKATEIRTFRILLCFALLVLAGILGAFVFIFFRAPEQKLAIQQFESIARRATHYAHHSTMMKRLGVITMASIIGNQHPNKEDWPFVLVNGYDHTAHRLVQTIFADGMGFAPIVTPENLGSFEEFAYDSYYNTLGYPNTTAESGFGRGVWAKDTTGEFNVTHEDQEYHEGTVHPNGETSYGSPYEIFTPVFQHSDGEVSKPLMLNLHNEKKRGETIDNILDCAQHYEHMGMDQEDCGQLTNLLLLTQRKVPASLIMQPVYPMNDPGEVTGIVSSPLVWQDVFMNAFGDQVNGVHCVITSGSGVSYTYLITAGEASLIGAGDLHQAKFDERVQMMDLTDSNGGHHDHEMHTNEMHGTSSFSITLKIYPTEAFMETYRTPNPLIATIIIVCMMIILTVVFCLYDWYVRNEFHFKNELLEAKRNFIRFVSHEVRTPLNAVCMGLMLMREELDRAMKDVKKRSAAAGNKQKDNPHCVSASRLSEWKGVSDEILENSQNAVDVLNDLLNYDKITTGSLKLELSLLEIGMLMDHAQKEFKLPAAKKNIQVSFEDNAKLPYRRGSLCIVGDDVRLIQVLRNLMSNALKFTPRKGQVTVSLSWVGELPQTNKKGKTATGKKRISFADGSEREHQFTLKKGDQISFAPSGFVQLTVSDTGAGMSPDQMANVFEQGTQFNVNELQAGQGSGLGLYIAKGIMDQHLGSLTVASKGLGKGTTFTMSVPVYRDPKKCHDDDCFEDIESDHFSFKAAKARAHEPQDLSNLRILVVDDSDTNRKFLSRILANHGHTCDQARDGSIAVEMVSESMKSIEANDIESFDESGQYDAVLLDYEMPVMNGPTAAKKMREMGSDTFIVGITGNLLPEDVEFFRDQGANEVLPKPFNISDLEEILMEYGVGYRDKE